MHSRMTAILLGTLLSGFLFASAPAAFAQTDAPYRGKDIKHDDFPLDEDISFKIARLFYVESVVGRHDPLFEFSFCKITGRDDERMLECVMLHVPATQAERLHLKGIVDADSLAESARVRLERSGEGPSAAYTLTITFLTAERMAYWAENFAGGKYWKYFTKSPVRFLLETAPPPEEPPLPADKKARKAAKKAKNSRLKQDGRLEIWLDRY